eukprot:TRINITY_DN761_c0_g1_i3.p4 TRINITY_DN761_c0_g1~~TRINITY_DN761_c0_g1_i3.p4  ORF type:complete len:316 (-),score=56.83 TRINITY_DN761_c0_g1_i3:2308-3255(-)
MKTKMPGHRLITVSTEAAGKLADDGFAAERAIDGLTSTTMTRRTQRTTARHDIDREAMPVDDGKENEHVFAPTLNRNANRMSLLLTGLVGEKDGVDIENNTLYDSVRQFYTKPERQQAARLPKPAAIETPDQPDVGLLSTPLVFFDKTGNRLARKKPAIKIVREAQREATDLGDSVRFVQRANRGRVFAGSERFSDQPDNGGSMIAPVVQRSLHGTTVLDSLLNRSDVADPLQPVAPVRVANHIKSQPKILTIDPFGLHYIPDMPVHNDSQKPIFTATDPSIRLFSIRNRDGGVEPGEPLFGTGLRAKQTTVLNR